jgi:fructan beta-fructosidase
MSLFFRRTVYALIVLVIYSGCRNNSGKEKTANGYNEPHRPGFHFSPKAHWMNDPNGLVFFDNTYHLFFQYYPDSSVWGPMHWGHAVSTDLIHWQEKPIALFPDSLGYIFSGCIVVDSFNTSGLGKNNRIPLIAVFTQHNEKMRKQGRNDYQYQSIAYSLDHGDTWTKYDGNPVLENPGIADFRDPNIIWYAPGNKWIMSLATKDRVTFYSSPDLKAWNKETEFGNNIGAHGGVWECPDLFSMDDNGKKVWVLSVSINPGGPNGGSATQYFTGDFDGNKFVTTQKEIKWIDWGTDNYAGVSFHNTGDRRISLGWMSNWDYAQVVPTTIWRSAMTIPREVALAKKDSDYFLRLQPVKEIALIQDKKELVEKENVSGEIDLTSKIEKWDSRFMFTIQLDKATDIKIRLSNSKGEELIIGFNDSTHTYYIDRTKSGNISFDADFPKIMTAPRIGTDPGMELTLIIDRASAELFADKGLTNMTAIFFPEQVFNKLVISAPKEVIIKRVICSPLGNIW